MTVTVDTSGNLRVSGTATVGGINSQSATITNAMISSTAEIARTKLAQDTNQAFSIPLTSLRVHDAITSLLPASAASDDLGLDGSTLGAPHVTAGDLKAAGSTTRYARFLAHLPVEYDDGETVYIRCHAGMQTTAADTSCTLDVECYKSDEDGTGGSDLYAGSAVSINSVTFADYDFAITPTGLVSGDTLDVRVTITCNDGATGTAVEPTIGAIQLLCDIRG